MTHWSIENIDETEEAISQRESLKRVREFLLKNNADEELIQAVDIAIVDIEDWISTEVEAALRDGVLQPGKA